MIQYSKLEDKISTVDTFLSAVNQQTLRKKLNDALVAVRGSAEANDWFNLLKTLGEVGDTIFVRESRDYGYIMKFIDSIKDMVYDEYYDLSHDGGYDYGVPYADLLPDDDFYYDDYGLED